MHNNITYNTFIYKDKLTIILNTCVCSRAYGDDNVIEPLKIIFGLVERYDIKIIYGCLLEYKLRKMI